MSTTGVSPVLRNPPTVAEAAASVETKTTRRRVVKDRQWSRMLPFLQERTEQMPVQIAINTGAVANFCRRHHITRLALFGSVLRDDFGPDSDVDVLVRFHPQHIPGLIRLGGMAHELSQILGRRQVDLLTQEDLSEYFREDVEAAAEVLYDDEG